MLFDPRFLPYSARGCLLLTGFILSCALYVYWVNARRLDDDPKKQDFPLIAALLAPVMWLPLIVGLVTVFLMQAIVLSFSLLLTVVGLLVVRKPFLFVWWDKIATKVGTMLLKANTSLIRAFFRKPVKDPET
jgi:hypothetical protein